METDGTDSYKLRFDEIRYKVNTNCLQHILLFIRTVSLVVENTELFI